jgi:hypothetical protein
VVVPIEPGPHGPPDGWWTVKRNGLPVRHFPGKEKAVCTENLNPEVVVVESAEDGELF